jgi:F0F1-type ATP synthase assembly protein I
MNGDKNHEQETAGQEKMTEQETDKSEKNYLNEGMIFGPSIGLVLGLIVGLLFLDDFIMSMTLGMVFGMGVGTTIGASIKKK